MCHEVLEEHPSCERRCGSYIVGLSMDIGNERGRKEKDIQTLWIDTWGSPTVACLPSAYYAESSDESWNEDSGEAVWWYLINMKWLITMITGKTLHDVIWSHINPQHDFHRRSASITQFSVSDSESLLMHHDFVWSTKLWSAISSQHPYYFGSTSVSELKDAVHFHQLESTWFQEVPSTWYHQNHLQVSRCLLMPKDSNRTGPWLWSYEDFSDNS